MNICTPLTTEDGVVCCWRLLRSTLQFMYDPSPAGAAIFRQLCAKKIDTAVARLGACWSDLRWLCSCVVAGLISAWRRAGAPPNFFWCAA